MTGPQKILVEISGRAWGGVLAIAHDGPVEAHMIIGSVFTDKSSFDTRQPLRMLDGRVEIGKPISANDRALQIMFVSDGSPGGITRDQAMTAVRVCALWRNRYRNERGRIPIEAGERIVAGLYHFDMEKFRALVRNWEESQRFMREYPSKHSLGE